MNTKARFVAREWEKNRELNVDFIDWKWDALDEYGIDILTHNARTV